MLVAQITDIHLGFEPGNPREGNRQRLDAVLHTLAALDPRPDLLFATGDLTEFGAIESYQALREAFSTCPFPVWPCLGNHDLRAPFRELFPKVPVADGFVQYVVDAGPLRFIVLDTLEEGIHGGGFCHRRASWLEARLAEAPARPTILILHHPPIETGIDWMTAHPDEPWVRRLGEIVARHPRILRLLAGHIHRPILSDWAGTTVAVCPSTAPQLALGLGKVDVAHPDGRPMIVAEPPAFALHYWTGRSLVTHFGMAGDHAVLARFDGKMQPVVQGILSERAGTQSSSETGSVTR